MKRHHIRPFFISPLSACLVKLSQVMRRRCVANITDGNNVVGAETTIAKRSVLNPVKQLSLLPAVGSRVIIV